MSLQRTFIVVFLGLFWACSGNSLPAQSAFEQNVWETLPVFHNGRVMPLHTFAQQTVREICGTTRPYIIWDDAIIAEFNKIIEVLRQQSDSEENDAAIKYRFLNPNQNPLDGGFNRNYSVFDASNQAPPINTVLSIQGLDRARVERIAKRIRQLVPPEGRYFTADEILLSWVCEPEVWTYIPLFLVRESDYLDEMFGISFKDDARTSQYRVSLYQLENSPRYKQRCADIRRRQELGQITKNPIPFDQITERLENQVRLFRELTFHPYRQRPDRMLSLLNQAVGMSAGQSPYSTALDAWSYLLALGEVPGRQSTERSANSEEGNILHPTTQRWHDIADKLHLLMSAYQQSDSSGNAVFPNPLIVEEQYENLIKLLDTNLAESAALMESIYTDVAYRTKNDPVINIKQLLPRLQAVENQSDTDQIRRIIISYYYSVKKLRKAVEAAYLALYDNGLSLRFLPMRSTLSLESTDASDHFGVPPWASAQMILGSGDTFVKRFFDPQLQSVTTGLPVIAEENETIDISENAEENTDESTETSANEDAVPETSASETAEVPKSSSPSEQTKQSEEQLLFLPFTMESGILSMNTEGSGNLIDSVRNNIRILFASYSSLGGAYGSSDFAVRMQQFQYAVRHAAVQIETYRESLTEEGDEHYVKTAYPESERKLLAEYRYDRLNPFFWMWFFALLAVLFNVGAYIAAITRSKSAVARTIRIHSVGKSGENQEKELQDYTNSVEEWLFIGSVAMLICSIFIAFVGGVMRASITGWAPITNMYETVVMMAFSTAVLGLWYALHPFLHPALQWAWACSQFPSLSTLQNWLSARKEKRLAQTHHETSGEVVSPEMAEDFGLPEGVPLGVHSPVLILTPAEIEAQHHVEIARRKMLGQILMLVPRLLLSFGVFYFIVLLANGEYVSEHGFTAAAVNMFAATDMIDLSVVIASVFLLVWIIPHVLLMLILIPIALLFPSWLAAEKGIRSYEVAMIVEGSEHPAKQQSAHTVGLHHSEMSGVFHGETRKNEASDTSGAAWLTQVRNAVLNRKLFIAVTALIVFVAGLAASLNRVEFNPDIRPIAAVLRSNFWLTVHVIAIVVSYAAAFVAWGMAVISLGYVIFGRYLREPTDVSGQKVSIRLPATCQMFSPVIERLLRIALLLLVVGTVLGARWADYSWGRFWSWDPKEVWALITILFYVVVFHGRIARYYGIVGITVGALFASIAVIITWYGINFVFKGSVHSYGGGAESNAAIFLGTFIAANVLWGALALLRYSAEVYGSESAA